MIPCLMCYVELAYNSIKVFHLLKTVSSQKITSI